MGHLIADVLFVLLGFVIVVICARRGFLKIVARCAKWVVSLLLTSLFGGVAARLLDRAVLKPLIHKPVLERFQSLYENALETLQSEQLLERIPRFLQTEEVVRSLQQTTAQGSEWIVSVSDALSSAIASLLSNLIGYLLIFLVSFFACMLLTNLLEHAVERVRLLNSANTLLGALVGLFMAFATCLTIASLLALFLSNSSIYTNSVVIRFLGELLR